MKPYRLFADGPEQGQLVELFDADEDAELGSRLPEPKQAKTEHERAPKTTEPGSPK